MLFRIFLGNNSVIIMRYLRMIDVLHLFSLSNDTRELINNCDYIHDIFSIVNQVNDLSLCRNLQSFLLVALIRGSFNGIDYVIQNMRRISSFIPSNMSLQSISMRGIYISGPIVKYYIDKLALYEMNAREISNIKRLFSEQIQLDMYDRFSAIHQIKNTQFEEVYSISVTLQNIDLNDYTRRCVVSPFNKVYNLIGKHNKNYVISFIEILLKSYVLKDRLVTWLQKHKIMPIMSDSFINYIVYLVCNYAKWLKTDLFKHLNDIYQLDPDSTYSTYSLHIDHILDFIDVPLLQIIVQHNINIKTPINWTRDLSSSLFYKYTDYAELELFSKLNCLYKITFDRVKISKLFKACDTFHKISYMSETLGYDKYMIHSGKSSEHDNHYNTIYQILNFCYHQNVSVIYLDDILTNYYKSNMKLNKSTIRLGNDIIIVIDASGLARELIGYIETEVIYYIT